MPLEIRTFRPLKNSAEKLVIDRKTNTFGERVARKNMTIWRGPLSGDGLTGEPLYDQRADRLTEVYLRDLIFISKKPGSHGTTGDYMEHILNDFRSYICLDGPAWQAIRDSRPREVIELIKGKTGGKIALTFAQIFRLSSGTPLAPQAYGRERAVAWGESIVGFELRLSDAILAVHA